MNPSPRVLVTVTFPLLAALALSGCHVTETGNGANKKVDIGTPFGSLNVNTNEKGDLAAIGLSAYPGAVPDTESGSKDDHNNADVNLSFGDFHLGVKAATFQTSDAPDKVLAFYRTDLAKRYGDPIECHDNQPVGTPTRTAQGLTCSDNHGTISTDVSDGKAGVSIAANSSSKKALDDSKLELRAGSGQHQHIVTIETKGTSTKIGLVALDLPSHLGNHNAKDSE